MVNDNSNQEIEPQGGSEEQENNTEPQQETNEETEVVEIGIDQLDEESIDKLSNEELEQLIDNADNLKVKVEKKQENEEEQEDTEVNGESKPDTFDINTLPDEYKKVFEPIKANGKVQQFKPDEIVRLVQLGTKYYADRQEVKENLKTIEMIKKAGIEDQDQLIQALDLVRGDKQAIAKFIKDNGIDLSEIDELIDGEIKYEPNREKYQVSDAEIKLQEVDRELRGSEHYDKIYSFIENIDNESRTSLLNEPQKILALEAHMQNGLYDQIVEQIQKENIFGKYIGVPFIKAYEEVGNAIVNQQMQQKNTEPRERVTAQNNLPKTLQKKDTGNVPSKPRVIDLNDESFIDSLSDKELENLLRG